jgi:hypothetical protein
MVRGTGVPVSASVHATRSVADHLAFRSRRGDGRRLSLTPSPIRRRPTPGSAVGNADYIGNSPTTHGTIRANRAGVRPSARYVGR